MPNTPNSTKITYADDTEVIIMDNIEDYNGYIHCLTTSVERIYTPETKLSKDDDKELLEIMKAFD
jgi:hypothetical protein